MSVGSAIARFRTKQAEQFTDRATVRRPVGEPHMVGEVYVQDAITIYTNRPCKVRPTAIRGEDQEHAGETLIAAPDSEAKFDVDSDLQRGDLVTMTSSTYDAGMVGRSFVITRVPADAWQISRIVIFEETLPPLLNEVS